MRARGRLDYQPVDRLVNESESFLMDQGSNRPTNEVQTFNRWKIGQVDLDAESQLSQKERAVIARQQPSIREHQHRKPQEGEGKKRRSLQIVKRNSSSCPRAQDFFKPSKTCTTQSKLKLFLMFYINIKETGKSSNPPQFFSVSFPRIRYFLFPRSPITHPL